MKKRMLTFALAIVMACSLAACGEEETASDTILTEEENEDYKLVVSKIDGISGLSISLPETVTYAQTNDDGVVIYSNDNRTTVISFYPKGEAINPEDLKQDKIKEALGGLDDMELDNMETVEGEGGTSVLAVGTCSISGTDMKVAMQYFIPSDGSGCYIINYLYGLDENEFDTAMMDIVSSAMSAG